MDFSLFIFVVILIIVLLYMFWDVNYFIRIIFITVSARFFQQKLKLGDTSEIYGLCTTQDADVFHDHMNNARYVRELDFARYHFYYRTGFYHLVINVKGVLFQNVSFIRYRKKIPLFTPYKITTKLIYYTDKLMFLEDQFITLNDGFVRAIMISKQHISGIDVRLEVNKMLGREADYQPPMPTELQQLTQYIEISSARFRKKD